ncbi:unnamed protein product [Cyprideis torosa]|uniref:ABC-type xenobiotic transporter n=1 Tax=Cyprideis torosa TaxID=163714 RepID=A0A7R8WRX1_9CRUS|nr:unnamed protein product [Cyprideis torosa]CAG0904615.1 unnamed protein product [Cyprideis torosa]
MRENAPECNIMFIGFVASVLMGASMPLYAILFGEVIGVLSNPDNDEAMKDARYYAFLFIGAGVGAGIAAFLQASMFGIAGEQLTLRMRRKTFAAMLRQEISWYDRDENNTGTLTSRLSGDAASMQGASGSRVGTVTQALTTLTMAFSLALYYSWRLGLVTTSFVPLILLSSYIEAKIIFGKNVLATNKIAEANKVVIEAITNIRTVAGLRKEKKFHDIYATQMVQPHQLTLKKSHVRGILFGFAQSLIFFAYAACMYYGGTLMEDEIMLAKDVFKVAEALILGTMMVGQAIAFAPNYNMAMVASARIFNLLDRVPEIDAYSEEGDTVVRRKNTLFRMSPMLPDDIHALIVNSFCSPNVNFFYRQASVRGDVCFRGVHFHYPTRPTAKILNGLNLDVVHGRTVALVGESGCGKSTCIALLERFYDPTAGEVRLDEAPLPSLKVASLRKAFSLVSQEPVLFDRTIAENIAYGDNSRPSIPMAEIITAARKANIHDFISKLPHGYETSVGSMGSQLSGGEKQRVAIARALISNPEILLLDEATSALDATSEKVVQQALDAAQEGRTCLVIAHRLSTIVNADVIFVFRGGHVVESGTHQELIKLQGVYYHLYNRAKLQA